jgi:hypothetical protein
VKEKSSSCWASSMTEKKANRHARLHSQKKRKKQLSFNAQQLQKKPFLSTTVMSNRLHLNFCLPYVLCFVEFF